MKKSIRSAAFLRSINILYLAQVSTLVMFSMVVFYLNRSGQKEPDSALAGSLQYPLTIAFIIGLAVSQLVPRYLLRHIDRTRELKYKLSRYVTATIIRGACLELPGIFACIVALMSGRSYYLLVIPLLVVIFLLYRPSRRAIASELNLSNSEREQLNDPDAVITERG